MKNNINLENKIDFVEIFHCGYCKNNLKNIFKGEKSQYIIFSAKVALIHHKSYGFFLYDTGYSADIYNCGILGKLYNSINPTFCRSEDEIIVKLSKIGLSTNDIKSVIISHFHPDHIGGLKYFSNSNIIISQGLYLGYKNKKFKNLIFKNLLPEFLESNLKIISDFNPMHYFELAYDLFSDGSAIIVQLDGHTKGQLGIYLPEIKTLFAADSCWKLDFLSKVNHMKFLPKLVQNNFDEYKTNIELLKYLHNNNIQLIFSHDDSIKDGRLI